MKQENNININILRMLSESNQLLSIQDENGGFVWATKKVIHLCGFKNEHEILGKNNTDIRCVMAEKADYFDAQNEKVFLSNKNQKFIGVWGPYANGEIIAVQYEKIPFIENNQKYLMTNISDISTHLGIIKLHELFIRGNDLMLNDYAMTDDHESVLTERETDIFVGLLQGLTAKESGKLLNLSYRTIEKHLENIKFKLNVTNQKQLLDKASSFNFFNLFPRSYLETLLHRNTQPKLHES